MLADAGSTADGSNGASGAVEARMPASSVAAKPGAGGGAFGGVGFIFALVLFGIPPQQSSRLEIAAR